MAENGYRGKARPLASNFFAFSIVIYVFFTISVLVVWNVGIPRFGIPGRVPELLEQENDSVRFSLSDKLAYSSAWLASHRRDARGLAQIDASIPLLNALAFDEPTDTLQKKQKAELEARYKFLCDGTDEISRILVLRRTDGNILVDSLGGITGSTFFPAIPQGNGESGQFRNGVDIVSFSAARSSEGAPLYFVLVSPLSSLMDEIRESRFDALKGLGFALSDAEGKLLYPLAVPESAIRFEIGQVLVGADKLELSSRHADTVLLPLDSGSWSIGAAALEISAEDKLFIVVAAARDKTMGRIAMDSAAVAFFFLLLTVILAFVTVRYLRIMLAPLARLSAAVEAFGQSEPFSLSEDEPGELGEITRAFIKLSKRVEAWKSELKAEVDLRTRRLWLAAELCGIYAQDVTEKATIAAVNILKDSFEADTAALFYVSVGEKFRFCLAGTDYSIALTEERWRECIRPHSGEAEIARFGPWAPPGLNVPVQFWVSYRLYSSGSEGGYIFLGRAKGDWSAAEETDLIDIARTIAPIVEVRHEREFEEQGRKETEEKLANNERRLRTFLEGSRDMIYSTDSDDVIREINAAGVSILGCSRKDEILGKTFSSFALNIEDRELLLNKAQKAGYAADHEIVLKRKDGGNVYCLETAYAIRDPEGGIIELQGIVKDITERMNRESMLWKTNIELADANLKIQRTQALMVQQEKLASIGQLAAGVAHEINNPLGFLKSNHQMLRKYLKKMRDAMDAAKTTRIGEPPRGTEGGEKIESLFSEVEGMLAESDEGFSRIMNIVSNLKSFSRIEQGGSFSLYDVNAGIESTITVARNEIKYVAETKLDLGDLPQIRARGTEINQVILNIIVNAAQAIESQKRDGKGLIEIRTFASDGNVVIKIQDDGPGIPEAVRTKIFDPFFTTKEPGRGTGLGLSISYDIIVSKHGGRLTVDSAPGKGSCFTIELPIAGEATQ